MTMYVIANQQAGDLDSPVFFAGEDGNLEAIAVFSERGHAKRYLEETGCATGCETAAAPAEGSESIAELAPLEFVSWLTAAYEGGIDLLVIDPDPLGHLCGEPQRAMRVEDALGQLIAQLEHQAAPGRLEPASCPL